MIKHLNTVWIAVVAVILALVVVFPDWLTRESISALLNQMGSLALMAYLMMSLTRSMLLIPCTPFVLAGAITFPQWPFLVFTISLAGVVVGAILVYSFPSFGGYDRLLEEKYPDKIASLKRRMQHKNAFWFVVGWSFFPLVPTDAVCYVAGIARMPLRKMLAALVLGELPLVAAYVFLGAEIGEWLRL
ncbi:MAG: VTT domain-containing protein [Pseudohongiellaceae bacterium]